MDLSPLRKFEVTGPDAEALLQYCADARHPQAFASGQVVYTAMCYEHGGMIDDGTVFRLGQNNFRWIGGDDFSGVWLREQAQSDGLQGLGALLDRPAAQHRRAGAEEPRHPEGDHLDGAAQPAIGELEWFRFAVGRIGHFDGAAGRRVAHRLYRRTRL